MSKKKHAGAQNHDHAAHVTDTAEYRVIGHDLVRVLLLNILYLAAILAVYYTNHSAHYLENAFAKILHW